MIVGTEDVLHDMEVSLNAALFIVDRLIEEIKEEEGRLENDQEVERLFHHLSGYLLKMDQNLKTYRTDLHSEKPLPISPD